MKKNFHRVISPQQWASERFREERVKAAKIWYWRLNNVITDESFKEDYLLTAEEFDEVKKYTERIS